MADLATLGLAVDSSPVKSATSALQDFSKAGKQAQQSADGVVGALGKTKGPAADFAKNFAAADEQQGNYSKTANKVVDSLANQFVRLNSTKREWAQLSAIQKAGVEINSDAADKIGKMAGALFDLEQAQKKVANDNSSRMAKLLGGSQIVAALGLFGIGFTQVFTAAKQLYDYLELAGPTTETLLKEHDRLIGIVKRSYDEATKSAKNFFEQSKDVTRLQLLQQEIDLQRKLKEEVGKSISGATTFASVGDFFSGTKQVKEQFQAFEDAIFRLKDGFDQGTPNVREFADEVARIGLQNPALQKAAIDLIENAGSASELAEKLKAIKASLDLLDGKRLNDEGRASIGLSRDRSGENLAAAWDKQLSSLSRRNAAMEAEARTVGQSDAAHEKMHTTLLLEDFLYNKGVKNIDAYREQIARAGDEAARTADKLARARIGDQIKFDRNTALLSQEDVAIASQLRSIYPDVADGLGSVEASAMRTNNAMRDMSSAISGELTSGLTDIVSGAKSVKDGFNDMANSIIKEIERMIIKLTIVGPLMRGLQGAIGGFSFGGAGAGSFTGQDAALNSALFPGYGTGHSGAIIGQSVTGYKHIHPAYFDDAPRFHKGGTLGVNEVPFIGLRGEEVGFPKDLARKYGSGAPTINIINQSDGKVQNGGVRQNPDGSFDVFIRNAVTGVLVEDAAKNGPISKAMSGRQAGFNGS